MKWNPNVAKSYANQLQIQLDHLYPTPFYRKPLGIIVIIGVIVAAIIGLIVSIVAAIISLIPMGIFAMWYSSEDIYIGFDDITTSAEYEKFLKKYRSNLSKPPRLVMHDGKIIKGKKCDIWALNQDKIIAKGKSIYEVETNADLYLASRHIRPLMDRCRDKDIAEVQRRMEKVKKKYVRGRPETYRAYRRRMKMAKATMERGKK